jgi:glutathione synthase/RimK-type ligase-like ATP-grasp enzyme
VLGPKAMAALDHIREALDLDYAGVDFGLDTDGALLLFEANATMVLNPPGPEAIWDYRRHHIDRVLTAAQTLLQE